jgi:sphinganine-1-phosphate aldolase
MDVARQACAKFVNESQFYLYSQPSIQKMTQDILAMIKPNIDGGDPDVTGTVSIGGTESISLAIKAARDHARSLRDIQGRPNIVVPSTAHPAFNKAPWFFDMETIRVPVNGDLRADVAAMEKAITPSTVMLMGSAPSYTHGVIDPIEELGQLALSRNIWLHVDGCVGGIILPFMRKAGQYVQPFDFSVPGVMSMSADLHKHGYTPVGVSTIWVRGKERQAFHQFRFEDWPNGLHRSPVFNSSRPASPLAGAWATLLSLGEEGYLDLAKRIIRLRDKLITGINATPHLYVCSNPDTTLFTYTSDELDMFAVGDGMARRGWYNFPTAAPVGQHITIEPARDETMYDDYLADLKIVAKEVADTGMRSNGAREVSYG